MAGNRNSSRGGANAPAEQGPKSVTIKGAMTRSNLTIIDPNIKLGGGYDQAQKEAMMALYDQTFSTLKENQVMVAKVMQVTPGEVIVDIGFKSEGSISRAEFANTPDIKVGDEVEVFLETIEDREGRLVLSRRRADFIRVWEKVNAASKSGEVMQVTCLRRIKGGIVVDLMGMEAFLPGSQIDTKPVRDFDEYIGRTLDVRVVKVNQPNENVVVSHKMILEETQNEQRGVITEKLERGQVLEGTVKAIADFGAFVDLGGVDGLVHITDLSWGRVTHPSEVIKLDQTVTVVVLDFDENKKRISLGMKQLMPHPWKEIELRFAVGQKVKGKIVSMTDYGAFLELEKGIEGLIHVSEMSWTQHVKHPSNIFTMGQECEAIILNIDQDAKKISLGVKQLEPDPWTQFLEKYPIGSVHKGTVRNLTAFGAFIELEPGVDGLVHISDLSWTKKIRHPGELLKKGDEMQVMILGIDTENRRIALGHKQVLENPWESLGESFSEGTDTNGKIIRIIDKGVIVELPGGIDGFVPASQLSFQSVRNVGDSFKMDESLNLRVIEFDSENKKIVLSATEWLKGQDADALAEYNAKHAIAQGEAIGEGKKPRAPRAKKTAPAGEAPAASIGTFELPEEMLIPEKTPDVFEAAVEEAAKEEATA